MWYIPDVNLEAAASAEPTLPTLAQARIRSDQLNTSERDLIADLFAVLEELGGGQRTPRRGPGHVRPGSTQVGPALRLTRQQRAQHRHRRLGRFLDEGHDGLLDGYSCGYDSLNAGRGGLLIALNCRLQHPIHRSNPTNPRSGRVEHRAHRRDRAGSAAGRRCG
ncbi:MAG: hypothetical protein ACRDSZ_05105 [Pseudonocardiaceae bacterium]